MKLLDDENIEFTNDGSEAPSAATDDELNQTYAAGEIRIVSEQARYQLSSIRDMVESDDYELKPDFQRRHRWSRVKQSRLIETFIMNVPVPPVFLYENQYSHYEVMDGQQRLTAIKDFYADKFELEDLEYWQGLNGRRYSDLPEKVRRGIDRRHLSSIILLYETAKDEETAQRLKQLVFQRINSGGERLEEQETRNALYPGPLNDLCIELSENESLRKAWKPEIAREFDSEKFDEEYRKENLYKKMDDVELVLRFFAARQRHRYSGGAAIHPYLDRFLIKGNRFPERLLQDYRHLFVSTIELVYAVFGETAFYRWDPDKEFIKRPLKVIYDPVMYAFSQYLDHAENLKERRLEIRERIKQFYEENQEPFEGRKTNIPGFVKRNELMTDFVSGFVS